MLLSLRMIELNRIYNADCLVGMQRIPDHSIDAVICDLPYGTTGCAWDSVIPFDKLWEQYNRIIKPNGNIVLFSCGLFTVDLINSNRKDYRYKVVWNKNVPTGMVTAKNQPMRYYEEICIFGTSKATYNPIMKERVGEGKDCYKYNHYCGDSNHVALKKQRKIYDVDRVLPSDVLTFSVVPNRKGKLHPTQKPVDLLRYLVCTYTDEGDTVLDNTCGSGTTCIACIKEKRNFIGFELDKDYYEKACKRIDMERMQPTLFQ